jgi:hypothetical protein
VNTHTCRRYEEEKEQEQERWQDVEEEKGEARGPE